ncbi:porin family protein [Carboxylicivirga marina]|uniref:porin family protein n=1 Tax=Carboxylicivirga marina TaxID=2800988 RepID=UPI00259564CA|nr:porin family protein [uncultured Carboxylicivirga sp.]
MKKLSTFLFLFVISSMVFAQESKIAIGFQMANSITSLRGNSFINEHYDSRFVISPGITFDYTINERFSFNSGLAFERKGAKTDVEFTDGIGTPIGKAEVKANYDYLTLPLLVSYHTNGKLRFYFGGGTFFGFLLSQKGITEGNDVIPEQTWDNTENTKRIDVGLAFKAGINLPMSDILMIDLGLRDHLGLLNTSKVEVFEDGSIKTNAFSAFVGLKYKL